MGGVPAGAYESQAPQGEQTIALSTVGGPGVGGTFTVAVDADPVSFERAFLVYELVPCKRNKLNGDMVS